MDDFKVFIEAVLDSSNIGKDDIKKIQKTLEKLSVSIDAELDKKQLFESVKKIIPEIEAELKRISGVEIKINDSVVHKAVNNIIRDNQRLQAELDKTAKKASNIKLSIDAGDYKAQMEKAIANASKWSGENSKLTQSIDDVRKAYEAMIGEIGKEAEDLPTALDNFEKKLNKLKNDTVIESSQFASQDRIDALAKKYQDFYDKNTAAHKKWGKQFQSGLAELTSSTDISIKSLNELEKNYSNMVSDSRQNGLLGKSFIDKVKDQAAKFSQWVSISSIVMQGVQSIRAAVSNVIELDNSLLELSKVSDLSAKGLEKITDQAYELGERVGKTGTQVIDAVTEFKRAGYDLNTSTDMAEAALTMTNVAEGINSTADAAGTLISVLKGYNMDESETMSIVDKINEVSNTSPIGFDEIAEGLERTAGTMAQSGTSIDETIALLTAGFAQLRNIEKVSTSLITLSARLRGVDENGDTIDGLSAQLQDEFGKIGVAIEGADGELRSIYDIARDYAEVLPTLTSKQKQYYAELAAGKRNVTTWNAITQQFQDAETALASSLDSAGSAAVENEKYLDSISGKISQFKSSTEQLSATLIDSDLIKFFVELGTKSTSVLNGIINGINTINSFGGALDSGIGGTLGAISGLVMNRLGVGEHTNYSDEMYCAHPLKAA